LASEDDKNRASLLLPMSTFWTTLFRMMFKHLYKYEIQHNYLKPQIFRQTDSVQELTLNDNQSINQE
jgi:hypothetical protein